MLDRWLAAQNAGDFAGYRALYAERFQGTKRVGLRTQRFDQQGWLRDRERMFAQPMQVEVSEVAITTTSNTAVVRFVQRWSSGSFQDRGPKMLLLVAGPTGLLIAHEELLDSTVESARPDQELAPGHLEFVVHTLRTYVVLADDGSDELAAGPPVLDSEIGVEVAARRTIAPDKLPAPLSARRGASVRLYGTSDLVCRARLGEPFLLRRLVPHFGAVQAWRGDPALGDRATPATPDEVARDTWDEATERTLLVAALDDVRGDCSGALWARSDELPDPTLFAPQPVPGELRARLERSVRALPAYRALAKRYAESQSAGSDANAQPPHWERFGGAEPALRAFGNDERQFVTFAASAGGCGDFSGRLWALFEVRGPALGLLNHPGRDDEPAEFVIDAIVDADGDGRIELLAPSVMLRATRGPTVVRDVTPPFHDCGC